jgi:hypothetical protein
MQELPRDRLAHAEFGALSEFDHAPNGLPPVFLLKEAVLRKTCKRGVEHFLYRAVKTAWPTAASIVTTSPYLP